jgi:hypothetical protein
MDPMWVRHDLLSDFLACAEHFAMVGAIFRPAQDAMSKTVTSLRP